MEAARRDRDRVRSRLTVRAVEESDLALVPVSAVGHIGRLRDLCPGVPLGVGERHRPRVVPIEDSRDRKESIPRRVRGAEDGGAIRPLAIPAIRLDERGSPAARRERRDLESLIRGEELPIARRIRGIFQRPGRDRVRVSRPCARRSRRNDVAIAFERIRGRSRRRERDHRREEESIDRAEESPESVP